MNLNYSTTYTLVIQVLTLRNNVWGAATNQTSRPLNN